MVNAGLGDTTRQGRRRAAKGNVAEMAAVARRGIKLPTLREVSDVGKTRKV